MKDVSVEELQAMASRQQRQIEAQQQMLVAKEQRLKYLRQQDFKQQQISAEYERLRRLREKVEAQELKLRKLRALRGQQQRQQSELILSDKDVLVDLEAIRALFNEKEDELNKAIGKVEELTAQLDTLRSNSSNNQAVQSQYLELERLRQELSYRRQLNEQQNNMIAQQKAQLAVGRDEIMKIDHRIVELQDRLARKRSSNQQLATQIGTATSAKQAQLKAIQRGFGSKQNKPVSTVEPFLRRQSPRDENNEIFEGKHQTMPFQKTQIDCLDTNGLVNESDLKESSQVIHEGFVSSQVLKFDGEHANWASNKPALPPKPNQAIMNGATITQLGSPYEIEAINVTNPSEIMPDSSLSVSLMDQGTSVDDEEFMDDAKSAPNIGANAQNGLKEGIGNNDYLIESENGNLSYQMLQQLYAEFDHLSQEQKSRIFCMNQTHLESADDSTDQDEFVVPEIIENEGSKRTRSIIKGLERQRSSNNNVRFDPLALLLDASLEGELELVQKTSSIVADISAANDEGITALHNAICAGHFEIVQFLVHSGCNVNAQDSDGWTPLHCAASCNNLQMAKFLVENGACIYSTTFSDAETAAEKCEEDEENFAGCSEYLFEIQDNLGLKKENVFAVFDFEAQSSDELGLRLNDALTVIRRGDEKERLWWWVRRNSDNKEGYVPRNHLGYKPRILPHHMRNVEN